MSLRIRRGTEAQRAGVQQVGETPSPGITFDLGEIAWTTDTKKLYVGDGSTVGGYNVLATSAGVGLTYDSQLQQLRTDDTYIDVLAKESTRNLFSNGEHVGITFAYTSNSISASVDFAGASDQNIRDISAAMFDSTADDINFVYDTNSGKIAAMLVPERVRYNAQGLFTSEFSAHNGISFSYDFINNAISASLNNNYILDTASALLTDNSLHTNIEFTYDSVNNKLSAAVVNLLTDLVTDTDPMLGGNLDINSHDIVGNGNVLINGVLRLTPQLVAPELLYDGILAIADGVNWNPMNSNAGGNYPVYYNGSNWAELGNYPRQNVFFVDANRTDDYSETGSIISPFKRVSTALVVADIAGYGYDNPAYIVIMSNIVEDIELTAGGVHLVGYVNTAHEDLFTITGTITINSADTLLEQSHFSISNLKVNAVDNAYALSVTGANPQLVFVKNCMITGEVGLALIDISNTGIGSLVVIDHSKIKSAKTQAIDVHARSVHISYSEIINTLPDCNGLRLSQAGVTATLTHCTFDIQSINGYVIDGIVGTTLNHQYSLFKIGSNRKIAGSINNVVELPSSFASQTPPATYTISADVNNINEGDNVTFTINTTNVAENTRLYWTLSGTVEPGDFLDAITQDSVLIGPAGDAYVTVTTTLDGTLDGEKTFQLDLLTQSFNGNIVATSETITINDTSTI